MEAIRCQGLSKRYGNIVALDRLTLSVEEGIVFGYLGPNGAGKTTTLRLLTGLSTPTSGRAWVAGEEVRRDSLPLRQSIGYQPEVPALYGWMTGREYLDYVGRLFRLPPKERRERCEKILERVGLVEAADRRISGYSRGMRQRMGIAQALVNRPQILFLDEPASGLDPLGRREILKLIFHLKGEVTVFMSSHILADVERVCDVVGILNQGKLIALSPMDELRRRYAPSAFELCFEEDASPLLSVLQPLPWVAKAEMQLINGIPTLFVQASDLGAAKQELPKVVAESGLTLLRYELTLPHLEDIFVRLMGKESR